MRIFVCNAFGIFKYYECICTLDPRIEISYFNNKIIDHIACTDKIIYIFKNKYNRIPFNFIELKKFAKENEVEILKKTNFSCISSPNYNFSGKSIIKIDTNENNNIKEKYFAKDELEKGMIVYLVSIDKKNYALYGIDFNNKFVKLNGKSYFKTNK